MRYEKQGILKQNLDSLLLMGEWKDSDENLMKLELEVSIAPLSDIEVIFPKIGGSFIRL